MVKESKLKEVEGLRKLFETYSVIGFIDLHKMPSKQLQEIRKKLRGDATIKITKKSVTLHALDVLKNKNVEKLRENLPQEPGIVFSNEEAFRLYSKIDKLKSPAAAKEGDIAPEDIWVKAGSTNLLPGPVISEFAKVNIPAGVEEGKIAIKKDVVAAKKGTVISRLLAGILKKLSLEPMLVGLNIVAIYQDGIVYKKESLSLVGEGYLNKLREAFSQALSLSVAISYPTKENINYLLSKAHLQAEALKAKIGGTG